MAKERGLELFRMQKRVTKQTSLLWVGSTLLTSSTIHLGMTCSSFVPVLRVCLITVPLGKQWHLKNFGDSTLARELLRLEEHAHYILILKMAATKAALSPNILSSEHRQLALTGSGWCSKTMDKLLHCFLDAKKPLGCFF